MSITKCEDLCMSLDNIESIVMNFKKLFIAKFSHFIKCSAENIDLDITNVDTFNYFISCDANLSVKIATDGNDKVATITGINFKHMFNEDHNKNLISYNNVTDILDQEQTYVYSAIFNNLHQL